MNSELDIWGPMDTGRLKIKPAWLLVTIGIIAFAKVGFILSFLTQNPEFSVVGDAADYIDLSRLIAQESPDWYTSDYLIRAPGYPAFLAGMRLLGFDQSIHFVLANVALGLGMALLVFDIARRAGHWRIGCVAALIISVDPTLFYYQTMVLTETLFAFLVTLILWILCVPLTLELGSRRKLFLYAVVLGGIAALALTVRHVMLMFPAVLAAIFLIHALTKTMRWREAFLVFVIATAPSIGVATAWSAYNQKELGIESVRSVGQHLHLWRGPSIVSRATGQDRWVVRAEMEAAIPEDIRDDPAARDAYQRQEFLKIIARYPVAFVTDVAVGGAKLLLAPSQGPLERFFADELDGNAGNLDFLGFSQETRTLWGTYIAKVPGFFLVLIFSSALTLCVAMGTILALLRFPRWPNDIKSFFFVLFIVSAYFIVLSSSASLDSRFRTPFIAALVLLATFGWSALGRDVRDWWSQSSPRKVLMIAVTILGSRNSVAYQIILFKLLRMVCFPLDFILSWFSWQGPRDDRAARHLGPVIVIGNHRSGTTILAQVLQNTLPLAPMGNMSILFPNAPVVYSLFRFVKGTVATTSKNFYGFSAGFFGISDCYEVWDRWFGVDHSHPRMPDDRHRAAVDIQNYFSCLADAANTAVLAKNNRATLSAGMLALALPEAIFVYVERDPDAVIRSVLTANKAFYGDVRFIWGLRPTPDFPRVAPVGKAQETAAAQQRGLEIAIAEQLAQIPPHRLVKISFASLVAQEKSEIETVIAQVAKHLKIPYSPSDQTTFPIITPANEKAVQS
ncbi:MAG: hypothetical protein CMM81_06995 [Rhodospirillales bacterium]|jgi:4-amino-4-deoxy-L-arabinose transferase-like glycosyltransferase|nr:hypothetical protein [Rhodospirillales bacterium]|tara:strand:+ start:346 stop:2718 length:2373 start_codon:yes stop_codon:yes gene_type:complete